MSALFSDMVATGAAQSAAGNLRSAALLLHAMHAEDRAWTLAQLPSAQRLQLDALLSELNAIGLPPEPQLIREAIAEGGASAPAVDGEDVALVRRLRAAAPGSVAQALRAEPAVLVQRVLRMQDWPWRSEVSTALRAQRADLSGDLRASNGRRPNALDRVLMQEICARVGDRPDATAREFLDRLRIAAGKLRQRLVLESGAQT